MFLTHSHTYKNFPKSLPGFLAAFLLLQSLLPVYAYFHQTQQSESVLIAICNTNKKILLTFNYVGSEPSNTTLPGQERVHCPVCVLSAYADTALHLDTPSTPTRTDYNTVQYPATSTLTSIDRQTFYAIRAPPISHHIS